MIVGGDLSVYSFCTQILELGGKVDVWRFTFDEHSNWIAVNQLSGAEITSKTAVNFLDGIRSYFSERENPQCEGEGDW